MAVSTQTKISQSKRLTKAARRHQLLAVAKTLLERKGAQDLTLALLAKEAGVSKPIAYDHFGTRSGLLIAMLDETGRYYELDAEAKIAKAPATIPAIAEIVATAFVNCTLEAGAAAMLLAAAAEADKDARDAGRAIQRDHAKGFGVAFASVLDPKAKNLPILMKSLVAAANAICEDLTQAEISKRTAVETLTHLMVTSLSPFADNRTE